MGKLFWIAGKHPRPVQTWWGSGPQLNSYKKDHYWSFQKGSEFSMKKPGIFCMIWNTKKVEILFVCFVIFPLFHKKQNETRATIFVIWTTMTKLICAHYPHIVWRYYTSNHKNKTITIIMMILFLLNEKYIPFHSNKSFCESIYVWWEFFFRMVLQALCKCNICK